MQKKVTSSLCNNRRLQITVNGYARKEEPLFTVGTTRDEEESSSISKMCWMPTRTVWEMFPCFCKTKTRINPQV